MKLKYKKAALTAMLLILSVIMPYFSSASLFSAAVSAAEIASEIDYTAETIDLSGIITRNAGPVKYMYSPNVNPKLDAKDYTAGDAKKLAAEKWYPVYGDTIDISKFISDKKEIVFAFREADELPGADGVYSSRVKSAIIPKRPAVLQATFKNNAKYVTSPNEGIILTGEIKDGCEYKVGIGQWIQADSPFIEINPKYNANGGTVSIRKSATADSFASDEYKIKIPKAPAAPKLRVNNGKIIGIKLSSHKWSVSEDGIYAPFTYTSINLGDFEKQMEESISSFEIIRENNTEYIAVFIKVEATEKKPSSPVQRLLIPRSSLSQKAE